MEGKVNEAKLRQLLRLFQESDIEELEVQQSFWRGTRVRLTRRSRARAASLPAAAGALERLPGPAAATTPAAASPEAPAGHVITSPMVGTFYRSSSPETEPFLRVGDRLQKGQTICIIEAMKIMNEVPSDVEGEVLEVMAENAAPVEYGQPLFRIRT